MRKWESEKHNSWCMPAEGFKGHVATDGSLLGKVGKWKHVVGRWCSWIMMKRWSNQEDGVDSFVVPPQEYVDP